MGEILINNKTYTTYDFNKIDKNKYFGFIYVTINNVNDKKYVGQHKRWIEDYIGSGGRYFKLAVNKHGKDNFTRHIIDLAETQVELNEKESFYINEAFGLNIALSNDWYNTKDGSQSGGNPFAGMTEEDMNRLSEIRSEQVSGKSNPLYGKGHLLVGENNGMYGVKMCGEENPFYGKNHSEETKKRWSEIRKGMPRTYDLQRCKITLSNGDEIIFETIKDLIKYFKDEFDLSKPIVIKLLKTGETYNPKNKKAMIAKGLRLERIE